MTTPLNPLVDEWTHYAIVDEFDRGGVLNLIRIRRDQLEEYKPFVGWEHSPILAKALFSPQPPPTVQLKDFQVRAVIRQIGPAIEARATTEDAVAVLEYALQNAWGTEHVRALEFGEVYVQWVREGEVVRVELVSNTYLSRDAQLTPAEQFRILDTGMLPPYPEGSNWSWTITTPDGSREPARAVVRALGLYGVTAAEIPGLLSSAPRGATD